MKNRRYISRELKLGIYLPILFSLLFLSTARAQDYVITTAESWHVNQTLSTNVIVDAGGVLTIDAGVVIGFNYADVNSDTVGDLRLEVRNGGRVIINGTNTNPVIFQGTGSTPPVAAGNSKWWQGIKISGTGSCTFSNLSIKNADNALLLNSPASIGGVTIDGCYNGITIADTLSGTVEITAANITNATGGGIVVNNGTTIIRNSNVTGVPNNGIVINAPNVTIDWTTVTGCTGSGVYNTAAGTNVVIKNSSLSSNSKSGLFNLLGNVTVTNSAFNSNTFQGVVNSAGTLSISQSDVSNNAGRGILASGAGTTTIRNITDTANGNVGVEINPIRVLTDVLTPTGTADATMPTVSCLYSNLFSNSKTSTPANIQVSSLATSATPVADFTTNWWGVSTGIINLVSMVMPNSVNYINWRIAGTYSVGSSSVLSPTKSVTITYPMTNQNVLLGETMNVTWTSVGNIPFIIISDSNATTTVLSKYFVVPNTGSYSYIPNGATTDDHYLAVKSYSSDSTTVKSVVNPYTVITSAITINKPVSTDTVYGNRSTVVRWVAPSTVSKIAIVFSPGGAFTTDSTLVANNIDASLGNYTVNIPNSASGAAGAIRVVDVTTNYATGWSTKATSSNVVVIPAPPSSTWGYTATGSSMSVAVDTVTFLPYGASPAMPVENKDTYVGAFWNDGSGTLKPCGYARGIVTVTGVNQFRGLTVWGDDPTTSSVKEGPAEGDKVYFKVWRQAWGTSDSTVKVAKYNNGVTSTFVGDTTYATYNKDGLVTLDSLFFRRGSAQVSSDYDSVIYVYSNITSGRWFLFSSFVQPAGTPPTIVTITDSLRGIGSPTDSSLVLVKNGLGQVYWPQYGINQIDPPIGSGFDVRQAYYIKVQNATEDTIKVYGNRVDVSSTPIPLSTGWNYVAYLKNTPLNIATALSSISQYLVIVKDDSGKVYWPAYSINDIGTMKPGRGYLIKVTSASSLIYPTASSKSLAVNDAKNTTHYVVTANSDNSSTIAILAEALKDKAQVNDEIGVFNSNGVLVGSAVYNGANTAIVVWGLENGAKKGFGMKEGEAFTIKVWSKTTGKENTLSNVSFASGSGLYAANGLSVISKVEGLKSAIPTDFAVSQNYPNPFNPTTTINFALPADSKVKISVYNVLGQLVTDLVNADMKAGYHQVNFNAVGLASGIYFYQINAGKFSQTKKMNLLK